MLDRSSLYNVLAMICFIKISLFIFCMIFNFSKRDGFTVLRIISIKLRGIKFIVSSLQPW